MKKVVAMLMAVCLAVGGESMAVLAAVPESAVAKESAELTEDVEPTRETEIMEETENDVTEEADAIEETEAPEKAEETEGTEEAEASEASAETDAVEETEQEEVEELLQMETETPSIGAGDYYEQESNNSMGQANAVAFGTTIHGSLTDNDTRDYYKVTLPATGALTLNMHSELEYYTVAVYDESGECCVYSSGNHWNEYLKFVENEHVYYLEKGTYYIRMTGTKNCDSDKDLDRYGWVYPGNYTCGVKFTNTNTNDGEPNNSFETATSLSYGTVVTGQISWNDGVDYYRIAVGSVGMVTLNITSHMKYYDIYVYDGNYKEIGYVTDNEWDSGTKMRQDAWNMYLEPGTYYIKIRDDGYGYYPGTYTMSLQFTATAVSFLGDDNSAANAKEIGWNKTYTGQISLNDKYDNYKFTLSKSRNVPLSVTSYMKYYSIKVYNSQGATVWNKSIGSWDSGWNESTKSREDTYVLTLTADTYYIEVSGNGTTGIYKFNFSGGELASLKLDKKSVKLVKGNKHQLNAIMSPTDCKVTWKSSNSKVVSVKSGKVTAKGYGKATITCMAQDGSGKTASCTVTVIPAKAKISSSKKVKTGRKVSIKTQSGVTGYEVYTKTKRGSWKLYKTIKGAKNKSFTVKNSYYNSHSFRVRAYKTVGKVKYYGAYSKTL